MTTQTTTATQPMTLRDAELLTPQQAAERLDVSLPTLRGMVRKGLIPEPIRKSPRWVRHRKSDIDAYIAQILRRSIAS